ncbi:MAG: DUF5696 domain-containing protein [Planctomycetes bacterium]|nr:DUF5696 domain-containing protein [Planctomycetota bacterium]
MNLLPDQRIAAAGFVIDPAQALQATVWNRPERRRQVVADFAASEVQAADGRVRLTLHSPSTGLLVPLVLAEDGPWLAVEIDVGAVVETRGTGVRLLDLAPLPRLIERRSAAGGHFLMPSYSGALVPLAGQAAACIRDRVYMAQEEWEKFSVLNCFALVAEDDAVLGVVDQGDFHAFVEAALDGAGTSAIRTVFGVRHGHGEVLPQDTLRLLLRRWPGAAYPTLALAYRDYLVERRGVVPLARRLANPVLAYAAEAMRVKIFHGQKTPFRADGSGALASCATFAESEGMVRALHAAGVAKAVITLVGWNTGGHDGAYPQRFPIEPAFGGEAGLRALIATCTGLGYQVVPHDNVTDVYLNSPAYDPEVVARDEHGLPLSAGLWAGGQSYKVCPTVYLDRYAGDFERVRDLGFAGCYYLDAQGTGLWRCHDPRHPADERQFARSLARILAHPRRLFGAVSCELGPAYTLPFADEVAHLHCNRDFLRWRPRLDPAYARAVERIVPFYQIAVHGLVLYQGCWDDGGVAGPAGQRRAMLHQLACGARPGIEIAVRELGAGKEYRQAIAGILPAHGIAFGQLRDVHVQGFAAFRDHGGRAYELEYADGTRIAVDLDASNGTIHRPGVAGQAL